MEVNGAIHSRAAWLLSSYRIQIWTHAWAILIGYWVTVVVRRETCGTWSWKGNHLPKLSKSEGWGD